ncbi:MAG: response regulator [Desulfococcaceae bacterium]|nr:response regulator [Desulfococcaceae bacterium]
MDEYGKRDCAFFSGGRRNYPDDRGGSATDEYSECRKYFSGEKGRDRMKKTEACVLIVDDNPKNLQVLGTVLKQSGYQIVVAQNGLQALKAVKKIIPDLILLDIMMPEMDGFETCTELKNSPETKDIPIIFLTAKTETEDVVKGFECGAVDYVVKPFNSIELLTRVNTHIELTQQRKLQGVLLMAGTVCHEMNQPLQSIMGFSELLLMEVSPEDPLYDKINKIREQVDKMGKITQKLMKITKYKTKNYLHGHIFDLDGSSE